MGGGGRWYAGGVFDRDGGKKEAKKRVVLVLLGQFQATITTTISVKWKLDIEMTWQTKIDRIKQDYLNIKNYRFLSNLIFIEI